MKQLLRRHGRTHLPGGSDPIKGFIAFNTDPQSGNFVYIETTASDPNTGYGFNIKDDTSGILIETTTDFNIDADLTANITADGAVTLQSFGGTMNITSDGDNLVQTGGDFNLQAAARVLLQAITDLNAAANAVRFDVTTDEKHFVGGQILLDAASIDLDGPTTVHGGQLTVQITNGGVTRVEDHLGNPVFVIDEDGDIHIKTGKTITADL